MPVLMNGRSLARQRGNRARGFDQVVREWAEKLLALQARGAVSARELAVALNALGFVSPSGGNWSASTLGRMLKRGSSLGFPFIRRSRSRAASCRKVLRRSDDAIRADQIEEGRRIRQRIADARLLVGPAITSPRCDLLADRASAQ